ncbi:MAG: hypothetical protein NVS9B1_19880 [Candidatus Dormibacteraceae bacterium]
MRRTATIFFIVVGVIFAFDYVSRHVLGLDCIGARLPVWGCVAEPYPSSFTDIGVLSGPILVYGGIGVGLLIAAHLLRDLVFSAAAFLLHRFRPGLIEKMAGDTEPKGYRIR